MPYIYERHHQLLWKEATTCQILTYVLVQDFTTYARTAWNTLFRDKDNVYSKKYKMNVLLNSFILVYLS